MAKGAADVCGMITFCLCGPKGSLCCFVLSIWGSIMLFLLGGFYWIEAVALFEDIAGGLTALNTTTGSRISGVDYYKPADITTAYHNAALSCWGAAVIYLLFTLLSGTFIVVNIWRAKVKGR